MTEPVSTEPIRFVIVTGLSGAGKSYAIKCLEDLGYFCVDNLPTTLIPTFAELCANSSRGMQAIALGVDVREGEYLANMVETIQELRSRRHHVDVLFLEASDETLVRRYHETRRRHPLAGEGNVIDGIRAERKALAHLREIANQVIDTTSLTVHQLKDQMVRSYGPQGHQGGLTVSLVSFGFKHGVPYDADLVFDVRFLPNPHFVAALRKWSGRHAKVSRYVLRSPASREFLRHAAGMLKFLLPQYIEEGKTYLTVAIGCTGGRHRSVAIAEALGRKLQGMKGIQLHVRHRDVTEG